MTIAEFADWWAQHKAGASDGRLLYLKDWHFAAEFPHREAYETPAYFQDDWLNDFFDMKRMRQFSKGPCSGQPRTASASDSTLYADGQTNSKATPDGSVEEDPDAVNAISDSVHTGIQIDQGLQTGVCTDSKLEKEQSCDDVCRNVHQQCQLATSEQGSTANATEADMHSDTCSTNAHALHKDAAANGGCGVECSDYRFVYLGCKVECSLPRVK